MQNNEHGHNHDHHDNHGLKATLGMGFGLSMLLLPLMGLSLPLLISYCMNVISVALTVYLGKNLYQSAWQAFKEHKITTETLYTISTLTILGLSLSSLLFPSLMILSESAPLVLGFWHLGEAIEHSLIEKLEQALDVRDRAPKKVLRDKESVSVKDLKPNDIITLDKGSVIPVDGILLEQASLRTTVVNGSGKSQVFRPNDSVKAGMVIVNSEQNQNHLRMQVTRTFKNSYLSRMAKNIKAANKEKAPVEVFANKVLQYFVPALLISAMTSGVIMSLLFNYSLAIQSMVTILVSACPCALSLITPMAVKIGMKKTSEQGIHFKNGKALQSAANIDTIVFDLNGTLTKGVHEVHKVLVDDPALLKDIAALERESKHPIAKSIVVFVSQGQPSTHQNIEITDVDNSDHCGIKGRLNGADYMIGNTEMLRKNGIETIAPPYDNPLNGTTYIVKDKEVVGQILIRDILREDAASTLQQLRAMGLDIHICTGADRPTAEYYANALGIKTNNITANTVGVKTKPDEVSKESVIGALQEMGRKVAMVGDALNDITAIAKADVGIAVQSDIGDNLTVKQAGISLHKGRLSPIVAALEISAQTKNNIYQNLFISLIYNSLVTLAGAGFFMPLGIATTPAIGVLLMILESAIVLANLYRLKVQGSTFNPELKPSEAANSSAHSQLLPKLKTMLGQSYYSAPEISEPSQPLRFSGRGHESHTNTVQSLAPSAQLNRAVARAYSARSMA